MSPEKQRVAIAEACGWVNLEWGWQRPNGTIFGRGIVSLWDCLPDYLNDLNATHEAEKILTEDQRDTYWWHLLRIIDPKDIFDGNSRWKCAHANAVQRAEAFLRTLELYETN